MGDAVFLSITRLASRLEVSEATVVRFSRNLGYEGFPQFKKALVSYYRSHISSGQRLKNSIEMLGSEPLNFQSTAEHEIQLIQESAASVSSGDFQDLVSRICQASRIFIFGMGRSNEPLVRYLGFRLARFGKDVREVPDSGINMMESLPFVQKGDLAVIFHFVKYTPDFHSLTKALRDTGADTVLVTDSSKPDFINAVDSLICLNRGPLENYHTLTVPFVFVSSILLCVAEGMGAEAVDFISRVGENRRKYYQGISEVVEGHLKKNR